VVITHVVMRRLASLAAIASMLLLPSGVPQAAAAGTPCANWCGGGEFHSVAAARILDSASRPMGPKGPAFDLPLLGRAGIPAASSDVLAVLVEVHVVSPSANAWVRVWGREAGVPAPPAQIYVQRGVSASATVMVRPSATGVVTVQAVSATPATTRMVATVVGWFSTSTYSAADSSVARGGRWVFIPTPVRLDSGTVGAMQQRTVPVLPRIPAVDRSNTTAAIVSLTASAATRSTALSVIPDQLPAGTKPRSIDLWVVPRVPRANLVVVPLGADGSVRVFAPAGSTAVSVDLVGYVRVGDAEATRIGRVVPLASSFRLLDTRQTAFGAAPLGAAVTEDWSMASFVDSVTVGAQWVGRQSGVFGSLTSVSLAGATSSSLTMYPGVTAVAPSGPSLPTRVGAASSLPVLARYGSSITLRVRNAAGRSHYVFDAVAVVLAD
jgi:hypothetical protein